MQALIPLPTEQEEPKDTRPSRLVPFFHAEVPLIAPGINESYKPARRNNGKLTMVHTEVATQFLNDALWQLRNRENIKRFDAHVFQAVSESYRKVPFDVTITLHLPTLWRSDVDGPDKIILDALFAHFKFLALPAHEKQWNDNRVLNLHVYKDADATRQPSIEIEVRNIVGFVRGK